MAISVGEAIRPATEIVLAENMFNPEPEEGNEYVLVPVTVACEEAENTCEFDPYFSLQLVGSSGIIRNTEFMTIAPNQLESTEFYPGASVTGNVLFEIQQDESSLVLIYQLAGFTDEQLFLQIP